MSDKKMQVIQLSDTSYEVTLNGANCGVVIIDRDKCTISYPHTLKNLASDNDLEEISEEIFWLSHKNDFVNK